MIPKKQLKRMYIDKRLSTTQIAKIFGIHNWTINKWLRKYDIKVRTISESKRGIPNPLRSLLNRLFPPHLGYKHSKKTKEKIRQKALGRIPHKETIEKIRQKLKGRKILWKDKIGKANKGNKRPDTSQRNKIIKKGNKNFLGKKHTFKTKKLLSKIHKKLFKDPKFLKKYTKSMNLRPNKPEKVLIKLIKKYRLPYKYTGDGSFWIEGMNPDFVNCNGKKICIEMFGDYWHRLKGIDYNKTESGRKEILKRYGYDCLVIWEHELKNPAKVINKINIFEEGI